MAYCPTCGGSVADKDRFCGGCGRDLEGDRGTAGDGTGPPRGSTGKLGFAAVGLVAAGALILVAGFYQVSERDAANPPSPLPQPSVTVPRPAASVPPSSAEPAAPPTLADCKSLVPPGGRMVCAAFEPNWAISLTCGATGLASRFTDAYSGNDIVETPGSVTLSKQDPWVLLTSHGLAGSIASTPGACHDDAGVTFDFTLTPTAIPGLTEPQSACCRIE